MGNLLVLGIISFGAGVAVNSFLDIGFSLAVLLIALGCFFGAFYFYEKNKVFAVLAIFILFAGAGSFRYELKDSKDVSSALKPQIGKISILEGIVADEPERKENYTRFIFKTPVLQQDCNTGRCKTGDKILVMTQNFPEFFYGDRLSIEGWIEKPENFNDFDWRAYLAKDDIFLQTNNPKIISLNKNEGNPLKKFLFGLKRKYIENLGSVLLEPHSSFASGLTVGGRESMGKDLLEKFRQVGIIHIVILSGYNVTIIADNIAKFFGLFLSKAISLSLGFIGIFLFTLLTGAPSTVVRAAIMAGLIYFAKATGRVYETTIALMVAGFFMLLANPKILRWDSSFQLSFLATLGLIFLAPRLENYFWWLPEKWKIKETGITVASAQLMVAPLLLQTMGTFSLAALPVNLLILIFIPATMFFGFLAGILGWISYWMALIPGAIAYFLLSYELWIVGIFAKISWSQIIFDYFPVYLTILIYLGIFIFIINDSKNS